ncbi:hypothetical protein HMPREF3199_01757 [Enterococcus faecium]|nr:hypothetical protein HMPREF3199_01757 [Enterococcus faecium]MBL4988621.1 hypothetical protein [Enterococcus lactis]MBL4991373.1 hypothetical protein [Enterococcus lactis]MBL4994312.1 hypothetical protein [Enterococcus lactis]MBL4997379.1 hypothetical protein [Enterococcus lactis]
MLLLETSLTSNNIEEVKNYLYDTPTFQRQSINFCMKNVVKCKLKVKKNAYK